LGGPYPTAANVKVTAVKTITNAVTRIYSEGGLLAFWTGNSLSVTKIFPESAIKFFAYESSVSHFLPCPPIHHQKYSYLPFDRNGPLQNIGTRWKTPVISVASVDFFLVGSVGLAVN
jgi:Mitochondrial carrier protein